jgi:hypothetical protein
VERQGALVREVHEGVGAVGDGVDGHRRLRRRRRAAARVRHDRLGVRVEADRPVDRDPPDEVLGEVLADGLLEEAAVVDRPRKRSSDSGRPRRCGTIRSATSRW